MRAIRRAFAEALMSLATLGLLLLVLVAVDGRVREQISLRLGDPPSQLAGAGAHVRNLAAVVFEVLRDQTIDHAAMLIFVLAATVLVLFMLRT